MNRRWISLQVSGMRASGAGRVCAYDGEEGVREHGEGDVPVPGAVEPDLVVAQPGFVLGRLEAFLRRSCGFVWNALSAGTFAEASRSSSPVHERGRYSSRSISALPFGEA